MREIAGTSTAGYFKAIKAAKNKNLVLVCAGRYPPEPLDG